MFCTGLFTGCAQWEIHSVLRRVFLNSVSQAPAIQAWLTQGKNYCGQRVGNTRQLRSREPGAGNLLECRLVAAAAGIASTRLRQVIDQIDHMLLYFYQSMIGIFKVGILSVPVIDAFGEVRELGEHHRTVFSMI